LAGETSGFSEISHTSRSNPLIKVLLWKICGVPASAVFVQLSPEKQPG